MMLFSFWFIYMEREEREKFDHVVIVILSGSNYLSFLFVKQVKSILLFNPVYSMRCSCFFLIENRFDIMQLMFFTFLSFLSIMINIYIILNSDKQSLHMYVFTLKSYLCVYISICSRDQAIQYKIASILSSLIMRTAEKKGGKRLIWSSFFRTTCLQWEKVISIETISLPFSLCIDTSRSKRHHYRHTNHQRCD